MSVGGCVAHTGKFAAKECGWRYCRLSRRPQQLSSHISSTDMREGNRNMHRWQGPSNNSPRVATSLKRCSSSGCRMSLQVSLQVSSGGVFRLSSGGVTGTLSWTVSAVWHRGQDSDLQVTSKHARSLVKRGWTVAARSKQALWAAVRTGRSKIVGSTVGEGFGRGRDCSTAYLTSSKAVFLRGSWQAGQQWARTSSRSLPPAQSGSSTT